MTLFKMSLGGVILTLVSTGQAWACEALLRSSNLQISSRQLTMARENKFLRDLVDHSLLFPILTQNNGFWSIVFDPRPNHKNEGYVLRGYRRGLQYITHSVQHSSHEGEKTYFKRVAKMHDLRDETIELQGQKGSCDSIQVLGWIHAKLWLKHGLKINTIREILQSKNLVRVFEHGGSDPRYRVQAFDRRGRLLSVIVAERPECPYVLVTAYTEPEEQEAH